MNIFNRIFKNSLLLLFSEFFSKVVLLLISIFIGRMLGVEELGIYSFVISFILIISFFIDFGLTFFSIIEISKDKRRANKFIFHALILKSILSAIVLAGILIFVPFLGKSPSTNFIILIASIHMVLYSFVEFTRSIFRAFEKMVYETLTKVMEKVLLISAIFFSLMLGFGLKGVFIIYLLDSILILVLSFLIMNKKIARFKPILDVNHLRKIFVKTIPYSLSMVFIVIYFRIDAIMISIMLGDYSTGLYSAAYTIILALFFIPAMISNAFFPVMSKAFYSSKKLLKNIYYESFKFLFILGLFFSVLIWILGDKILLLFFGLGFKESTLPLKLLSWVIVLRYVNFSTGVTITSIKLQKYRTFSQAITALLNIVLNIFLISKMGILGAAIATLISEICLFILYYITLTIKFYYISLFGIAFKPLIAATFLIILSKYLNGVPLLISILVYFATYTILILVLQCYKSTEYKHLKDILKYRKQEEY